MAVRQYIGARYVAKIYENSQDPNSSEWEPNVTWEPLVIVTYQNGSYMSKKPIPGNIGNPPANPQYWTQTGFYNGQIASLQHQVDEINLALGAVNDDIDGINADITGIKLNTRELIGNVTLNHFYIDSFGHPNGSCYVGNDRIVTYYADAAGGDTGKLVCFNKSTYSIMWQHAIKGYHGNSVTYNPENNNLYICGCFDHTNTRINIIVKIDLDYPDTVIREINLPGITECYSLTYDAQKHKFYATPYIGTTPGTSNQLCIYNEDLTELEQTLLLSNYPATKYGLSTQGVQLGLNGIAYVLVYSTYARSIYGYDTETGKLMDLSQLPAYANNCRQLGETQSIVWDYDNEDFFVGIFTRFSGAYDSATGTNYSIWSLVEVDMFKGIQVMFPEATNEYYGNITNRLQRFFAFVLAGDSLKPTWIDHPSLLPCPNDAIYFCKNNNFTAVIRGWRTNAGVTGQGDTMCNLQLAGFHGEIQGNSASDLFKVHAFMVREPASVIMRFCDFDGYECTELANGYWCNAFAQNLARVYFQGCKFSSYSASGSTRYHVISYNGAHVYCLTSVNTFSGSVNNNFLANIGGEITSS